MIGMMTTVLGLGLALFISIEAYSQGGLFAWHPFLMSFGALGLPTAGIQAVRSRHAVGGMAPKTQRVQLHSALSNLALASMLGGLYAIYTNKEKMGKNHWTSWHSWAGVLALALWVGNVALAGANTADLEKRRLLFLWKSRNHRWAGKAAFCAGLGAVVLGLHSGWGLRSLGGERGAWALTAGVLGVFVGIVASGGEAQAPKKA
ncbi:cytochrome b-561 domain containing 2 [Ectocarpus siliculosus]|uniref:Cytochrome b-561 domain containing 2 n=1 Tax=Ectocarpus siliculosus TaxID=2880 RepID=D7FZP2_ECTSI|nr:cytochrome b-561 domain containing 2 [Ectocarpus siliculosus]|eukprot:CBJ32849.1 cytochrome b-561 domain containing 2 [Ectocarpus siliculosus]